jgi:hypothetical protein
MNWFCLITTAFLVLASLPCTAGEEPMTPDEIEAWFEDDAAERARAVSEGQLAFLPQPPPGLLHHSYNRMTLSASSLEDGWLGLYQCHEHLDAVPLLEVVYQYKRMRDLKVVLAENVSAARVEGQSVQLEDVGKGARLCITADINVMYKHNDGSYRLRNGPYMRRFLDGYYPTHVTLDVRYPAEHMRYVGMSPAPQPGLKVQAMDGRVVADAWFEGELITEMRFARIPVIGQ